MDVPTIIIELLEKIGLPNTGVDEGVVAGQRVYTIQTTETKMLIGVRGETLRALEYVVKKIVEKQGRDAHFVVDVDNYRIKTIQELQQKAKMMAGRARSFQYDVEMSDLSAYERMIVHATLADEPNITTESQGEGKNRKLVIKYAPTKESDLSSVSSI